MSAEITITKKAIVPDGPVCVNWAYRTDMPPEQNFSCAHYRRDSDTFTDRDMGGVTDRINYSFSSRCALFDRNLSDETGVGPHKCSECIAAVARIAPHGKEG